MNGIVQQLCRAASAGLPDRELLDALVGRRDEAAFEALLRRHGPMVLAVCRRTLGNAHDAEDAFQATFLVLLRKAASLRKRDALASWLYGVAFHTARRARAMNARRHAREARAVARDRTQQTDADAGLDEALNALPEKYRLPVVLCELQGRPRKEVAGQLNIPEGTLSSRLATARKMLAKRLRQHGETFAGVAPLAVVLPAERVAATVRAAGLALAGQEIAGVVSTKVLTLTEGMVRAMFVNKLRALAVALVALGALGVGTGGLSYLPFGEGPAVAGEQPADSKDRGKQEADLAAALAGVKQAEGDLQRAVLQKAQADLKANAEMQALRERFQQKLNEYHALRRATRPGDKPVDTVGANSVAAAIASRLTYAVPFEIGSTETKDGGKIEILEVWGTRPQIEVGGYYLVRGKYTLPSFDHGTLYFHETTSGPSGPTPELDLQWTRVEKGQGEFTLLHNMSSPGYFHLHLIGPTYNDTVANVYFGTGENVWRKK
jgi:RNA polymerase sigma factor (sigma-70 family)